MSGRTEEHRRAQRRVLIGFGVVAVLAAGGIFARRSVSQPKAEELPDVALNGAVSCSGNSIQVTNSDSSNWLDARVEINSKYARVVPSIPPRQTVTLPAAQFTDSNGKPFAPSAAATCQSADVQAYVAGGRGHFQTTNLQ
jgi:hypothetical protein